ncbi:protease inhibitor I42 family protein [Chitinophaga agri]|uniref:Protease inhibitor I42 family protein n=1 Tax=Chitinophaga agri TaxID=2703787 RepID=A0A6B9ZQJ8_9BACT|nr:protease inhibitor I42 family protein [Chitinophaga agri]QHS63283.1 protease inhibitor I42 family protein [Chitinophaga agri]
MESEAKEIKTGTSLPVILPGLGSAGFQWFFQISNTECAEIRPYDYTGDKIRQEVGISNEEAFVIQGKAPGTTTIIFEQRRVWEKEGAAINARRFEITVI